MEDLIQLGANKRRRIIQTSRSHTGSEFSDVVEFPEGHTWCSKAARVAAGPQGRCSDPERLPALDALMWSRSRREHRPTEIIPQAARGFLT